MEFNRSDAILKYIVEYFIKHAQPVSSQTLIDEYKLPYSSATIRNEMFALEKLGLIEKTHTSSGRVPSSEGYKYYDNYVELTIYKGKTDEVEFTHTFNTNSFKQYIPENIQAQSSLVGFNFNYMEFGKHDKFHFIAVVGDPDETTDIAYSIAIDINPDYSISTRIVNNVDTEPISNDMNVDPDEDDA